MSNRREFLRGALACAGAGALVRSSAAVSAPPRLASDPFTLGVASGYPTSESVVLWTRLAPTPLAPGGGMPPIVVPVQWELALDERMSSVIRRGTEYAA